jgi:hypothetical protein
MKDEQIERLVERLLIRTREGKVNWEPTAQGHVLQAVQGDYVLRLRAHDDPEEETSEGYTLSILDGRGRVVHETSPLELGWREYFEKFNQIYTTARRQALGVDKAIRSLLDSLDDIPF